LKKEVALVKKRGGWQATGLGLVNWADADTNQPLIVGHRLAGDQGLSTNS
jgi:hypothetical protein